MTVTVRRPQSPLHFPLIPNYHLESHVNEFPQKYRYRYRLEKLFEFER